MDIDLFLFFEQNIQFSMTVVLRVKYFTHSAFNVTYFKYA